jgi:hypothetical protein
MPWPNVNKIYCPSAATHATTNQAEALEMQYTPSAPHILGACRVSYILDHHKFQDLAITCDLNEPIPRTVD